jgi:hypothetical protein
MAKKMDVNHVSDSKSENIKLFLDELIIDLTLLYSAPWVKNI